MSDINTKVIGAVGEGDLEGAGMDYVEIPAFSDADVDAAVDVLIDAARGSVLARLRRFFTGALDGFREIRMNGQDYYDDSYTVSLPVGGSCGEVMQVRFSRVVPHPSPRPYPQPVSYEAPHLSDVCETVQELYALISTNERLAEGIEDHG